VGLITLPPSGCLEIWEPQPPGKLRACPGPLRVCFAVASYTCLYVVCFFFFFVLLLDREISTGELLEGVPYGKAVRWATRFINKHSNWNL